MRDMRLGRPANYIEQKNSSGTQCDDAFEVVGFNDYVIANLLLNVPVKEL